MQYEFLYFACNADKTVACTIVETQGDASIAEGESATLKYFGGNARVLLHSVLTGDIRRALEMARGAIYPICIPREEFPVFIEQCRRSARTAMKYALDTGDFLCWPPCATEGSDEVEDEYDDDENEDSSSVLLLYADLCALIGRVFSEEIARTVEHCRERSAN